MTYVRPQLLKKNCTYEAVDLQNGALLLTMIHLESNCARLLLLFVMSVRCYYLLIIRTNFCHRNRVLECKKQSRKTCNCTNFRKICGQNRLENKPQSLFS